MANSDPGLQDAIDLLKKLVEIESPTHEKAGVDRVGTLLADECRRLGLEVEIRPQPHAGDQVIARWGGNAAGVLFLAHMDTVFPFGTIAESPFYEKDGKIFGPGTSDMKGGIVACLSAIAGLKGKNATPAMPVTILFTSDEETGSHASRPLIEGLAREARLVLVLEPGLPDGSVKTWRKGVGDFTVRVRGRAAHAGGDHEKGRNAIEELARQVLIIQKMTDYDRGTTLNVGTIRGGIAANVVPDEAVADVDLRVLQPGEAERIALALYSLKPVLEGTSIEVVGELNRPPMPFTDNIKQAFDRARTIAAGIGIELKAGGTGGASDGNFVAPLGVPILDGLGPAGDGAHSEREYILLSSLQERIRLLAAILRDWT